VLYYVTNTEKANPSFREIVDSVDFKIGPGIDAYRVEPSSQYAVMPATGGASGAPPYALRLATKGLLTKIRRHPCIGARSVAPAGRLFVALYADMNRVETAFEFLKDYALYLRLTDPEDERVIKTMAAMFTFLPADQNDFAEAYWRFAQLCHDIDPAEWDPSVGSDPTDENFELSFCGRAVFTTTLNPKSPRRARTFNPTWVMNQIAQFEVLRSTPNKRVGNQFEHWKNTIRRNDADYDPSGKPNPLLADHGHGSAFEQLAGSAPLKASFRPNKTDEERKRALERRIQQARNEAAPNDVIDALQAQAARL
jgi:FPC/CPF motif-containing protein YcgG